MRTVARQRCHAQAPGRPILRAPPSLLPQVPIKVPAGMPAEQAMAVIDYLKANPEAAKAAWQQAQAVMRGSPAMAAALAGQVRVGAVRRCVRLPAACAAAQCMRPGPRGATCDGMFPMHACMHACGT